MFDRPHVGAGGLAALTREIGHGSWDGEEAGEPGQERTRIWGASPAPHRPPQTHSLKDGPKSSLGRHTLEKEGQAGGRILSPGQAVVTKLGKRQRVVNRND